MEGLTWDFAQFPVKDGMFRPKSNPEYYENLIKELEEAPTRSWFSRMAKKWGGMIRFS